MKLFDKNSKIYTMLRILFSVLVIVVVSGCTDDVEIDAYQEYKTMTSPDAGNINDCYYCKIFVMTFNAMGDVATSASKQTRKSALVILALTYAFWLLTRMFILFIGAKVIDMREVWSEVLLRSFLLIVASTFLASDDNMGELYGYTIIPLMEASTDISVEYANIASNPDASGDGINLQGACNAMVVPPSAGDEVIPREMGEKFACVLLNINQVIYKMHLVGSVVKEEINICKRDGLSVSCSGIWGYMTSLVMIVIAFILTLFYPLYLLDFVLRAGIIATLMPFLVFAWVFPLTRGFTEQAFFMVLNMCIGVIVLTLLLTGVVSTMDMIVMDTYLTDSFGNSIALDQIATFGGELTDKLVGTAPQIKFIGFAQMVFTGILSLFMVKQSLHITNAFANVSGLDSVGAAVIKAMAKTVKAALNVASAIFDVASIASAVVSGGVTTIAAQAAKQGVKTAVKMGIKEGLKKGGAKVKERAKNRVFNKTARKYSYKDATGKSKTMKYNVYKDFKNNKIGRAAGYASYVSQQFKRKPK